jgi:hypothetical protein
MLLIQSCKNIAFVSPAGLLDHGAYCFYVKFRGLLDVNLIFCMLFLVVWFAESDFSND